MLNELAYKGEIHSFDLLTMECVANANSNITKSTPNETIAQMQLMFSEMQLPRKYGITREALKSLYDHSFDGDLDFAALSVCDAILDNGVILSHWGKAHVIKDETSSICAPIEIDGTRYYAVLISGRKKNGLQYPYAMRVFSDEYIKNELLEIYRTSPQNEMIPRQNADFQKFAANLLINYIIDNSDLSFLSNIEQNNNTEQDNSSIKTQNNNKENINCNKNMNQESEYQKSYNRGKKMIERYLRTLGKEQALSRIKNVLVQLTSDEQIAKSKYNKGQIDALTDYVYGLNEGKIRLTESQLHNVIKESVKQVLSELDWKTYANAHLKARDYVENNWDDDFRDGDKLQIDKDLWNRREKYYKNRDRYYDFLKKADKEFEKNISPDIRANGPLGFDGDSEKGWGFSWNEKLANNPEELRRVNDKYFDEWNNLNDFFDGKYEYQKGKGWQKKDGLDESIRRAIRNALR